MKHCFILLKYKSVKPEGKLKFAQVDQFLETEQPFNDFYQSLGRIPPKVFSGNRFIPTFSTFMATLTTCQCGDETNKLASLIRHVQDTAQHFSLHLEPPGSAHDSLGKQYNLWYLSSLVFLRCGLYATWIRIIRELVENADFWFPTPNLLKQKCSG